MISTLLKVATFPVSLPLEGVLWIAERIKDQAEAEYYDEGAVRGRLLELELKLDLGEITEEEYQAAEDELIGLLNEIRERRAAAQGL
ncbi:MAG: gas vesicle protein GvpG [Actinomycetes bacterium]